MNQSVYPLQHERILIRVRGEDVHVPSLKLGGCRVLATGHWLKTAQVFDEELVAADAMLSPSLAIEAVRASHLRADLYSFARPYQSADPGFTYASEPDNLAVVSTSSSDVWWTGLSQESRKNIRLAAKRGVVVRPVKFDDQLVAGIKRIYDETPVRQGRHFWHFGRDFERVKTMNATYLERSQFIGAYVGDELIGFIKYIRVDRVAVLIQILSMEAHRDKRTIYALLRAAVELCHQQGLESLTYGKYDYGVHRDSSLTEFKRRIGFVEHVFPRYFVPLTSLGRLSLAMGLHHGWRQAMPMGLTTWLHQTRTKILRTVYKDAVRRND
jgi:hypothetical protein